MSVTKFHDNPSSCFQDISVSQSILGLGCRVSDIATLRTWLKTGPRAHALLALFFFLLSCPHLRAKPVQSGERF